MKNSRIDKVLGLIEFSPNRKLISVSVRRAVRKLLEFVDEWQLPIKVESIDRKDWKILLDSYAGAIITYHPENNHQERAVFLKNEKILKKYGLTNEDIMRLDFC
jgi:hypothetical protein